MRLLATLFWVLALPVFGQTVLTGYTSTNGGILYLVLTNFSTNGTWTSFGLGANNTITGNEMVKIDVLGHGFSPAGEVQTSKGRRLYGTSRFPGLYPATNAFETSPDGFVTTIQVAMTDYVFRGETISVTVSNGLYFQGGRSNSSASGLSITNLSLIDYTNARPVFNWITPQFAQSTGSHYVVEMLASHWSAIYDNNGRPLQAIEVRASDENSHSVTTILTSCHFDYNEHGVGGARYAWAIPTATFNDTNIITVHARTLPYFGTNAVVNSADGVFTTTNLNYSPLKFLNNPNGTYGEPHANVSTNYAVALDSSGVVTNLANWTTNRAAFLTIRGAANAIALYNSNFFGRLDVGGGKIHFEAGGHRMGGTNLVAGQRPRTYVEFLPYPGLTRSDAFLYTNHVATDISDLIKVSGMTLKGEAVGTAIIFDGVDFLWTDDCDWATGQSAALNSITNWYATRNRFYRMAQGLQTASAGTGGPIFVRDSLINFTNTTTGITPVLFRNIKTNIIAADLTFRDSSAAVRPRVSTIWAYNVILALSNNNDAWSIRRDIVNVDYIGKAFICNLVEQRAASQAGIVDFGSSGSTSNMPNIMLFANTFLLKANWFYDDGTTVLPRFYSPSWVVGNYLDDVNIKGDEFATANGARFGNRPQMWGVGLNHNLMPESATIGTPGSFQLFYYGLNSFSTNATTVATWANFSNSQRYTTAVSAGNGQYSYLSTSPTFRFQGPRVVSHRFDGPASAIDPPGAFTAGNVKKGAFF
jgi:hypothetical protein